MSENKYLVPKHPFERAFALFCHGEPVEDIAMQLNIPLNVLEKRANGEKWVELRNKMPVQMVKSELPAEAEAQFRLIAENREKNLAVFVELRDHVIEQVKALKDGRLKVKKHWNNKGVVVEKETEPSTGDLVNIATYARTIAEGTYRALGDFGSDGKGPSNPSAAAGVPSAPAITIILPAAIAQPRQNRADDSQIIDLTDVKVSPEEPKKVN